MVHFSRHHHSPSPIIGWERVKGEGKSRSALKHGRNSLGVELDTAYCKLAASRLLNENTNLFGNAQLQIDLKPHAAVEAAAVLQESGPAYKTQARKKPSRARSPSARKVV